MKKSAQLCFIFLLLTSLLLAACDNALPGGVTPGPSDSQATPSPLPATATATLTPSATPVGAQFNLRTSNFRIEDDLLKVDVCIDLPDNQDWMIWEARIQAGEAFLSQSGGELIEIQPASDDGKPGYRCDSLDFDLPAEGLSGPAELTISSISAYPREGQYCNFMLNQVQPTLDARQSGIQVACYEGPGHAEAKIVLWPDTLSLPDAEATAYSAEFFTVPGPWSFTAEAVPTATPFPPASLNDPNATPYALFRTLSRTADELLAAPGWVATLEEWEHDVDNESYGYLSDGSPQPRIYQRETWYHIDENGRVFESVSFVRDSEENILETSAFAEGQFVTSAAPEEPFPQDAYRLHLNEQFLGNLAAHLRQGNGSASLAELDEQTVMLFRVDESFTNNDPALYTQAIIGDQISAYLDLETGLLRALQTVARLEDGSQRTLELMRLRVANDQEPPEAVLEVLNEVRSGTEE